MATTDSVTRRFAAAFGLLGQYAARTAQEEGGGSSNAQQQLTIFYGGVAVVVDGCKPEKAAELIRLASAAAGNKGAPAMVNTPVASRKESLRRFLSKRKGRYTATAPDSDRRRANNWRG
jgi:hypothetical protein